MEDYSKIEKFIDYVIGDEEEDGFDKTLPFGGLVKDAPDEAKKAYEEYVKEEEKLKKQGLKR